MTRRSLFAAVAATVGAIFGKGSTATAKATRPLHVMQTTPRLTLPQLSDIPRNHRRAALYRMSTANPQGVPGDGYWCQLNDGEELATPEEVALVDAASVVGLSALFMEREHPRQGARVTK